MYRLFVWHSHVSVAYNCIHVTVYMRLGMTHVDTTSITSCIQVHSLSTVLYRQASTPAPSFLILKIDGDPFLNIKNSFMNI